MRTRLFLILLLVMGGCGVYSTPLVHASCEVWTTIPTFADQAFLGVDICDKNGAKITSDRYLSSGSKTADAQIKATSGFVHDMVCIGTDVAATAGTIILYDNTAESGTALLTYTVSAVAINVTPLVFPLNVVAATGLYLGFTTTADVACYVTYR